jgi:hypothetical protein
MIENHDKQINIYVRAADYEKLQELSKVTGLSISKISWMMLVEGFRKVENGLLKYHAKKELPKTTHVDIKDI